jgi:CRISPR-associated protein Csx3
MKLVLCGPPRSGKSCLRFGLKEAIKAIPGAPYPYVITACPDGEGSWFQETAGENGDLAQSLKDVYKGKYNEEKVKVWRESVKNCIEPLTLIDIGGKVDEKNEEICAQASHAVLLAGDRERLPEWRDFCGKLKLQIIAEIDSDYNGTEDKSLALDNDGVYRGSIHHLERGDLSVGQRPTIVELAHILVNMVSQRSDSMLTYNITLEDDHTLKIGFGTPAQNDKIVKDATKSLDEMIKTGQISGGEIMRINGPSSIPVAMVLAHGLGHLYQALACYDPKLNKYVVAIAHGDKYQIGDLID